MSTTQAPLFSDIDVDSIHILGNRAVPLKKKGTGATLKLVYGNGEAINFQTPILTTSFNTRWQEGMNGYGAQVGMRLEGGDDTATFRAWLKKFSERVNLLLSEGVQEWTGKATVEKFPKALADESHPTYPPKFVADMKVPSDKKKEPDAEITTIVMDANEKQLNPKTDVTIGKKVVAIVSIPFIHFNRDPKFSMRVELDKVMVMDAGGAKNFVFNLSAPDVAAAINNAKREREEEADEVVEEPAAKAARASSSDSGTAPVSSEGEDEADDV